MDEAKRMFLMVASFEAIIYDYLNDKLYYLNETDYYENLYATARDIWLSDDKREILTDRRYGLVVRKLAC